MLLASKSQFAVPHSAQPSVRAVEADIERNRRMIAHGESLFTPGAPRRAAYRVESGALCHYVVWPDGSHDVIEFAFPGDIVGLGSLGEHVSTAQAVTDTAVTVLSEQELHCAIANDAALATRMASATDREFDYLRRRALQPGLRPVINRLAAYILVAAGTSCRSGETHLEAGTAGIASLTNLLDIPAEHICSALADLRARKLIAERDDAIVILDRDGLEILADA
jgi:CRP/FNR family transcriptional regulator